MELTNLMQCVAQTFGVRVGETIRTEIASALALSNVDISVLNAKIATIQLLLDADPNTPEFDVAQNLITTLTGLTTRITALEGDTRVAAAQAAIAALTSGLAAEVARAQAAEAALAAQITTINTSLTSIASQIAAIEASTPACDCTALAASIAANSTAIANLQGVDAAQAAQIAALQSTVEALSASLSSASTASAAAQATANAAAAAAAAAQATANAAAAAVAALSNREQEHHDDHETKLGGKVSRAEVAAIDCVALGNMFAAGIALGLNPTGY